MTEQSGAIRMVAFGVLEFKPVHPTGLFEKVELDTMDANGEVMTLVRAEIEANGWRLAPKKHDWKDKDYKSKFILLGRSVGSGGGFVGRLKIGEGTLQEVCLAAVHYLDHGRTSV